MTRPLLHALFCGAFACSASLSALAADKLDVVASFSILGDMVREVGGDHVAVTELIGPGGDTHSFSPSPSDAGRLSNAELVVFNGLNFEGWMERLIDATGYAGELVIASQGVSPLTGAEHHHADDAHEEHDDDHAGHGHAHGGFDPHAWQDLRNAEIYVANIRDGLIAIDPDNAEDYRANAQRYTGEIRALDDQIRQLIDALPEDATVVTGHASFGYFSHAYGLRFIAPVGLSTESEASAANMGELVRMLRAERVSALFYENMTNPSTLRQLAEESGLPIAGTLYADALTADGEGSTYLGMMRHNAELLDQALSTAD